MDKRYRRVRKKKDTPLTLDELMWNRNVRKVFNYLGNMRADNPGDAIGIMTVSEELKMPLSDINYAMHRLCVSGLGGKDSGFLYLTPDRGMHAHMKLHDLKKILEPSAQ